MAEQNPYIRSGSGGITRGIWGGDIEAGNPLNPNKSTGFFDWYDPTGDPTQAGNKMVRDALAAKTLGYGVAPVMGYNQQAGQMYNPNKTGGPNIFDQLTGDAASRYFGKGQAGQAGYQPGWSDNWNAWMATDKDGLQSALHQTGLRMNANYMQDPVQGSLAQTMMGALKLGRGEQPDVSQVISSMRNQDATSPYQMRQAGDYATQMGNTLAGGRQVSDVTGQYLPQINQYTQQQAGQIGNTGWQGVGRVQGAVDPYIGQLGQLGNKYTSDLMRGIDTEANQTLEQMSQGTRASMEAAGLGRSGAGQAAMLGNQAQIMEQANRDKQRTMAQFAESQAQREAQGMLGAQQAAGQAGLSAQDIQSRAGLAGMDIYGNALGQGMSLEAQNQQNQQNQLAQSLLAGLNNEFQGGQSYNQAERSMMDSQLQRMSQERQGNQQQLLQSLMGQGDLTLRQQAGTDAARSQGLADYMNMFGQREDYRNSLQDNLLKNAAGQQGFNQSVRSDQLNAMQMPLQLMLNLAGMSGPASQNPPGFWQNVLNGAGQQLGQAGGQGLNDWVTNIMFGGGQNPS